MKERSPTRRVALAGVMLTLALLLAALPATPGAQAAPTAQVTQVQPAAQAVAEPIDVVVVLDDSGSMATCWPWPREGGSPFLPPCRSPSPNEPSDPNALRYSAARLLLQLADPEDRIAAVRFDNDAEGIGALGTLQTMGDAGTRGPLIDSLQPPNEFISRGYTRIDLGLDQAIQLLDGARQPGRSQYVLLLTDGEPTHPDGANAQRQQIADQLASLRSAGVLVFPVVLCNSTAGCAAEFLREQFGESGVSEAATATDLLRVFSEVFARMKPDRSVITSGDSGLQLATRAPQGVQSMDIVTARGGLTNMQRDGQPVLTRSALNDPNIDVSVIEGGSVGEGNWLAATAGGGFAIVKAASYPQLLNPPPSVANSPASVRYYPAGKPPLLIAVSVGPGAAEPLLLDGETPMDRFGQGNTFALLPADEPATVRLQVGEDTQPLQLVRTFHLEARADLPHAEILSPLPANPGLLPNGQMRLQAGFSGGGEARAESATAYVFEKDAAGEATTPVYEANLTCVERVCTDESFQPVDGRAYVVYFVIRGRLGDIGFSDWAKSDLALEPGVYLGGLPSPLDLGQMPADGWPVELASGTQEEIGMIAAELALRRADTGEPVPGVTLDYSEDVPEEGSLPTHLLVRGLDTLRPGDYVGELNLTAQSPTGLPMDVTIRPAPAISVTLSVARPGAAIAAQSLDFGEVLFDTSPNFRLDQEVFAALTFTGKPFAVSARLQDSTCPELSVETGGVQQREGKSVLPVRLSSPGPIQPAACQGTLVFSGPDGDHDVTPASLPWQARVAAVEWSIANSELNLGDLQDAGSQAAATLQVRYSGKPPFTIQLVDLEAAGRLSDEAATEVLLTGEQIELPSVEVTGPPNEEGLYAVPLAFVARQAIPYDPLRGTFYSGKLGLQVMGLQDNVIPLSFSLRSPSIYQRYLAPIVVPIYGMPMLLCTGPLTLLLLLVVVARFRGRRFDPAIIEQEAVSAARQATAPAAMPGNLQVADGGAAARAAAVPWGNAEWGSVWGGSEPSDPPARGTQSGSGLAAAGGADPWNSSW